MAAAANTTIPAASWPPPSPFPFTFTGMRVYIKFSSFVLFCFSLKSLTNLCIYYYYKFEITNNISQRGPIGDLASALANASPKQQRTMLRGNLYPQLRLRKYFWRWIRQRFCTCSSHQKNPAGNPADQLASL